MSKTKEYYHEEINSGTYQVQPEPYIFKYTVYFYYGGVAYTVFGDTHDRIVELSKRLVPSLECLSKDSRETGYFFDCGDFSLPVRLFENTNPIYA